MMKEEKERKWIDLKQVLQQKAPSVAKFLPAFLLNYLIRIVHQDELNEILNRYQDKDGVTFMQELIHYFDLTLTLVNEDNIPSDNGKRYLFVSNHPLGGLDGICLSAVLGEHFGGKVKSLVNDLLLFIPNLRSIFVPINKHGKQGKQHVSLMEEAYASENQIITFPAGLCSRKQRGAIRDLEWKKSFIQKARATQRDIVPIYFEGENSTFFYRLGNIRKKLGIKMNLEMFFLSDEMFRNKHKIFKIHFGQSIPWQHFDQSRKPAEWAEWVKNEVYKLSVQ